MKAPKKNQMWLLALFAMLAMNMSWVQEAFVPDGLEMSSVSVQTVDRNASRNCVAVGSGTDEMLKSAKSTVNGREEEIQVRVTARRVRCSNTIFGSNSNGTGTQQQERIEVVAQVEGTTCMDCRRTDYAAVGDDAKLQQVANDLVRATADQAFRRRQEDINVERNMPRWEEAVAQCRARWKNENNPREGVIAINARAGERRSTRRDRDDDISLARTGNGRLDCLMERLENGETGNLSSERYFTRHIQPTLERMLLSPGRRREAMELLDDLREDSGMPIAVRGMVDAMYGFGHWNEEIRRVALDADDLARMRNRMHPMEYQQAQLELRERLYGIRRNAGADFRRISSEYGADGLSLSEFQYWDRAIEQQVGFVMRNPRAAAQALNDNRISGRPVLGIDGDYRGLDRDLMTSRLDVLHGRVGRDYDVYDPIRGDFGSRGRGGPRGIRLAATRAPREVRPITPRPRSGGSRLGLGRDRFDRLSDYDDYDRRGRRSDYLDGI